MKKTLILITLACSFSVSVFAVGLDTLKVSLPSLNWALQLHLPGYKLESMDLNDKIEGRYITAFNDSLDMDVTINMENNHKKLNNAKEIRDSNWAKLKRLFKERKVILLDSTRYESKNCAFSDFYVLSIGDHVVKQRNIIAYILSNNVCVTIQLVKSNYSDADTEALNSVFGSVKIIAPYTHVSLEQFIDGSVYFSKKNYRLAARILQKALDLYDTDRILNDEQLHELISDLGLAYGLSGQTDKAIAILNQGIEFDRFFPLFYYNLAGVYAHADNLTETIYYLFQAFQYKKNMPQGSEFPNPKKDELFQKYWKNEKFREAVRNM